MTPPPASVHASAVCVGEQAILIRGASGTGKSRLTLDLILAGRTGVIAETLLIGDDRVRLDTRDGRLFAHAVPELEGMIEIRGLGIRRCAFVPEAAVALVVDLAAPDAVRLPSPERLKTLISGVELPRIPVAAGKNPLPLVLGFLTTN
ncbi:HPr kinase/phosphorylase [Afipia felis]|uniref:HPr kinase/phosphorylase n=1 Tax=Afipia felis TaxID=1035 RepID=A0A090MWF8_AFIFE|nr:HPr kinase/phosphatase C-terminal domain-containing protein [Afipia felis]CEG10629.1 HPr kinase/phosphorylase [Afipia felis]